MGSRKSNQDTKCLHVLSVLFKTEGVVKVLLAGGFRSRGLDHSQSPAAIRFFRRYSVKMQNNVLLKNLS